jgi:hypothetical protein
MVMRCNLLCSVECVLECLLGCAQRMASLMMISPRRLYGTTHGTCGMARQEEGGLTPAQRLRRHASLSSVDEAAMAESSLAELLLDVSEVAKKRRHCIHLWAGAASSFDDVFYRR